MKMLTTKFIIENHRMFPENSFRKETKLKTQKKQRNILDEKLQKN